LGRTIAKQHKFAISVYPTLQPELTALSMHNAPFCNPKFILFFDQIITRRDFTSPLKRTFETQQCVTE
jgi:hypothetical protein